MKFNYCPICGTKTQIVHLGDDFLRYCKVCNKSYQDFFYTCVIIVCVNESGKIGLIKQSYGKDRYVLVAGFMKPGESAKEASIREIKEEIGLNVLDIKYLDSIPMEKTENLMIGFLAHVDGFINLSSEVKDIIFVDKEKALTLLDNAKIAKSFVSMVEDNDLKL